MAKLKQDALNKYWSENWRALELILWCAEYQQNGNGIEHGWYKKNHGYWFMDCGTIEYYEYED